MQPTELTVADVFQGLQEKLGWQWTAGEDGGNRKFSAELVSQATSSVDLVGYFNLIHPRRMPVLGRLEIEYFKDKAEKSRALLFQGLATITPPAIVLADGEQPIEPLLEICKKHAIPLFSTHEAAAYVVDVLRSYLAKSFASKTSLHGVFMDLFGVGVLIQGDSGIGKSELGLELITRGHGLIADDAVDLALIAQGVVEGRCPDLLVNLLEVRGLGLLNIRTIFGETAMRRKMRLRLVIQLVQREAWEQNFERLPTEPKQQIILGVPIREVTIPVEAGRNIAVLAEAAVRNTVLQMKGIDSYQEFVERQRKAMLENK